jgi:hypothetical protein
VFLDQAIGFVIADGDSSCPLEVLLGVKKIESRIATLVYPETLHSAPRYYVGVDKLSKAVLCTANM